MIRYQFPETTQDPTRRTASYIWNGEQPTRVVAVRGEIRPFALTQVEDLAPAAEPAPVNPVEMPSFGADEDQRSFAEGFAAGREAVLADAEASVAEARRELDDGLAASAAELGRAAADRESAVRGLARAIADLDAREDDLLDVTEARMVSAAFEIAESLIGRELAATDQPAVLALVRSAALVPERGDLILRLHPEDAAPTEASLRAQCPPELMAVFKGRSVRVVADETVERFGCVIDCGPARVDGQWSTALGRVRSALDS